MAGILDMTLKGLGEMFRGYSTEKCADPTNGGPCSFSYICQYSIKIEFLFCTVSGGDIIPASVHLCR